MRAVKEHNVRRTEIEWLRIISMLMIVMGHSIIHGGYGELPITANGLIATAMTQGSRIAVNIFVMISGYFASSKSFSIKKMKFLYSEIWFYSLILTGTMLLLGRTSFAIKKVLWALLPIASSQYWFATCYILLMLISPGLQIFITNIAKKQYEIILVIFFVAWSVMPQLHIGSPGYSNFGWFIYIYLLAAYIRVYPKKWMEKIKIRYGIAIYVVIDLLTVLTYKYGYEMSFFKNNAIYLYGEMNMIPSVMCSVFMFLGFINWRAKQSEIINGIAACTFGVYLIHDNPYMRDFIWGVLFPNKNYFSDQLWIIRVAVSVIFVFCLGTLIEKIRQIFFKRLNSYVDNKRDKKDS